MATLKPRSNGPSYSKTVIGTLAVDVCRGGATVLKVGGDNFASGASKKFFFDPPTFWPVGDKILLR